MTRRSLLALLGVSAVLAAPSAVAAEPYKHTTQATASGTGGAAATVDSVATSAARDVLRRGGNAVDAAVAAAAVLGVTEPYSCGIGGGGFMVIRTPHGKVTTIDSRETAPRRCDRTRSSRTARCCRSTTRATAASPPACPGTVAAWDARAAALRHAGASRTCSRPRSTSPTKGFVVDETFAAQTTPNIPWFDDIPSTAALYLDPDGTARDPGTVLRNPDMAKTYERIARRGADGFYRGADRRGDRRRGAQSRRPARAPTRRGGPACCRSRPRALPRQVARADPRRLPRLRRVRHGPAVLRRLDRRRGAEHPRADPGLQQHVRRADKLHYFLEASRYAFADRNAFVADPDYFSVPLARPAVGLVRGRARRADR